MDRRSFLAIGAGSAVGLFLPSCGLVAVPARMLLKIGGACSFCLQAMPEVAALAGIAGRHVRICDECVRLCLDIIAEPPPPPSPHPFRDPHRSQEEIRAHLAGLGPEARVYRRDTVWTGPLSDPQIEEMIAEMLSAPPAPPPTRRSGPDLACSFCDAEQREVRKLIAGPQVYVCGGCVADAGTLLVWGGLRA